MKVVLVDSAYFGDALSHARQNARINRRDAARNIPKRIYDVIGA